MSRAICLYLHVHQPYRVKNYSIFDAGVDHNYFEGAPWGESINNQWILEKVAQKSYIPTNKVLLEILKKHPEFKVSLSITGTVLEQLEKWSPEGLKSFQALFNTGQVEIVGETYYHSLAFLYSRDEFERQVDMHKQKVKELFNVTPTVFRNTELVYNNDIAYWADQAGYKGILAEGWDPVLAWRSPNYVYRPAYTKNIRLLMKNYRLSDDIAFRFTHNTLPEGPLTAPTFVHWINALDRGQTNVNLFMDYETFGEHHWVETGIHDFLRHLPAEFLKFEGNTFMTISEAIKAFDPVDEVDCPQTITWADSERDLTAWLGNSMQTQAIEKLYAMESEVLATKNMDIIADWRRLQASDHVYYMCTKWSQDGNVHAYFSPYESPYDAFIAFCNALKDLELRVMQAREGSKHHGKANRT